MSTLKQPEAKKLRLSQPIPVTPAGSDHPTTSLPSVAATPSPMRKTPSTATTTTTDSAIANTHPKGHKVRELADVWKTMDTQSYLHLTDTLMLGDVWVQPITAEPINSYSANVTFKQIVYAPHIKHRETICKMSTDDLLKILYLNDKIQWMIANQDVASFDDWLNEKSSVCVKAKGMDEGSNRAKLCNYILTEDHDFTFYPRNLNGLFGIFFRKICYHSYKTSGEEGEKIENPSMMKCGTRGKFEYILEAKIFPLPMGWYTAMGNSSFEIEEVPESQPV